MLTPEKAQELDKRVKARLEKEFPNKSLSGAMRNIAVHAAILAIQEYERMKDEEDNQKS